MKKHLFPFIGILIFTLFLTACGPSSEKKASQTEQRMNVLKNYESIPDSLQPPAPKSAKIAFVKNMAVPALAIGFNAQDAFAESSDKAIANFWHGSDFNEQVNAKLKALPKMPLQNVSVYRTTESTSVAEIALATSAKPMSLEEFSQTLAFLISKQPTGEAGDLLNNGYGNIFFVEVAPYQSVAVSVWWGSAGEKWYLNSDSVGYEWDAGDLFFLRNGSGT